MLGFLRRLFTPKPPTREDDRRLARLLFSEIKLYNESVLAGLREGSGSASQLLPDLRRSYDMYTKHAGRGAEADSTFRDEAIRILAEGDAELLEPALTELFQATAGSER